MRNPALACLLLCLPSLAQDLQQQAAPAQPMTARVFLVVDVSGSMACKAEAAIQQVQTITGQPVDEMHLACVAFSDRVSAWPMGWVEMPDPVAQLHLLGWLRSLGSRGNTILGPALREALRDDHEDLTVVVISDGEVEDLDLVLLALEEGQAARESPARVATLTVGGEHETMTRLGKAGGGGAWALVEDE